MPAPSPDIPTKMSGVDLECNMPMGTEELAVVDEPKSTVEEDIATAVAKANYGLRENRIINQPHIPGVNKQDAPVYNNNNHFNMIPVEQDEHTSQQKNGESRMPEMVEDDFSNNDSEYSVADKATMGVKRMSWTKHLYLRTKH